MMTFSETWYDLFGLAGLLNPFALLIGGYLGWRADRPQKLWIAGFAAAALTLILDVAIGALPVPQPFAHDAGALAVFPFRFVGGLIASAVTYWLGRRAKRV
ncbi:phosphatidylglycerophosphatase [Roseibium sp. LAB1]